MNGPTLSLDEWIVYALTGITAVWGWLVRMALGNRQRLAVIESRFDRLEDVVDKGFEKLGNRIDTVMERRP